jgi:hypothetical protein
VETGLAPSVVIWILNFCFESRSAAKKIAAQVQALERGQS